MPSDVDAADALRRGSDFGPFFAVDLLAEPTSWQRFSELLEPDHTTLRGQVDQTHAVLAAMSGTAPDQIEERVAASLWLLGWAARLFSPWLGAGLHGVVPTAGPDRLLWRPTPGQPRPLGLVRPRGHAVGSLADQLQAQCVQPLIEPLVLAVAEAYAVSRRVLWGNVASAVAGSATLLSRTAPEAGERARTVAESLLATGPLRDQGNFLETAASGEGPRFRRRSCCLLYRVAGAGLCADCVLATRG